MIHGPVQESQRDAGQRGTPTLVHRDGCSHPWFTEPGSGARPRSGLSQPMHGLGYQLLSGSQKVLRLRDLTGCADAGGTGHATGKARHAPSHCVDETTQGPTLGRWPIPHAFRLNHSVPEGLASSHGLSRPVALHPPRFENRFAPIQMRPQLRHQPNAPWQITMEGEPKEQENPCYTNTCRSIRHSFHLHLGLNLECAHSRPHRHGQASLNPRVRASQGACSC